MKIADMPAGPEMDRLVAEKVMGWRIADGIDEIPHLWSSNDFMVFDDPCDFKPSSEISSAWEVVERVTDVRLPRRADGLPPATVFMSHFQNANLWTMSAEDAAAEICRCALISVGCEVVP